MRNKLQVIMSTLIVCLCCNCSSNNDEPIVPTGVTKNYNLLNTKVSDLNGKVTFIENTNGSTTIYIELNNTVEGINNAVRLRNNTANIGGGVVVNLKDIDGNTGKSETTVTKLDNGEAISYDQLADFLGYLSIEGKDNNEGEFYAYADLGPNVLTGLKTTYNLYSLDESINGLAVFEERKKGTTSLTVNIFDINDNTELPASLRIIQNQNIDEIIHPLNTIKSRQNGYSFNEITEIGNKPILYQDLLEVNGYILINDVNNNSSIVSKGEIGINGEKNSN